MSPEMRREAVLVMQVEVELSQRRACGLMELYRATCRYRRRRGEDQRLRVRLRELAEARRRFRLPPSADPVSYTHLDVYKRQI